jgi:3-deoxy-manno-octulosonate cytidylyltransferase (CMP-KDO synthetase)
MRVVVMIPARYASSRYPGKPLARLRQPDGTAKTLVEMTWEAAGRVAGVAAVHVVTDDERIRAACEDFGASVLMTDPACENGTARCAAALADLPGGADVVVNLQGDAPLTPPWFVEALVDALAADDTVPVATPVLRLEAATYDLFAEDRRAGRVGGTTAVFDRRGRALYFSKEIVPFVDPGKLDRSVIPVFHHVGVYAYRPEALRLYGTWPVGTLETLEGLEQLRFLENGVDVACVEVEARGRVFWELNNPEDVTRIERVLASDGEAVPAA